MKFSKENLGINDTPATLFVGLGGIGSDIISRVAENCRPGETENLRFVVFDTNANDLKKIKKNNATITYVQTSSPQKVLDYLNHDEDARLHWFPNNTTLYDKTVSEGAGQVRAISRLALNATIKTNEIQKLYDAIDSLFLKDGGDLKQALRVVLVSSSCGGTGSGICMTLGMLVRNYLHQHYREKSIIVRGYILLPGVMEPVISTETELESLRRNGYATIKEINAFMIKASGFCSVKKEFERYSDLHVDVPNTASGMTRLEGLPYDFCFLLDRVGQTQEGMQTLDQYKNFAAVSLYEQNIGCMQGDAFSMEDNIIKEFSNGNNFGRNRFGGIGAAVLQYPYEDVVEYIAYNRLMDRIGNGESVGEWVKYDEAYRAALKEFKKKRSISRDAVPQLQNIYVNAVDNGGERFDIDIKSYLAAADKTARENTTMQIKMFMNKFFAKLVSDFERTPDVASVVNDISEIKAKDYSADLAQADKPGEAIDEDLGIVRSYDEAIKNGAEISAKNTATAVLNEGPSVFSENIQAYHIENLLRTKEGAMHPNAARYVLYLLSSELEKEFIKAKNAIKEAEDVLAKYGPNADAADIFDLDAKYSRGVTETCFDNLVETANQKFGMLSDKGAAIWDLCNEQFKAYVAACDKLRDALLKKSAYDIAVKYVNSLLEQYQNFFDSFKSKVAAVSQKKEDIISQLKYEKGNSIRYICGSKECLDDLCNRCPEGENGLLLPDSLNAQIFESIKKNAEIEKLMEFDSFGQYSKTDIFEECLVDYFNKSVREECSEIIDLDIIHAIFAEKVALKNIEVNKGLSDTDKKIRADVSEDDKKDYLKECIHMGNALAAPGIGCLNFNEPRMLKLCAYNITLDAIRAFDLKDMLTNFGVSPTSSNTVSKYELRFFSAIYNITPDKLSRFKSPDCCKRDGDEGADSGIYYKAYHDHIKKIGPDSTKSASISLHIDKRWDSITDLPELDIDAHRREMMNIHAALIYGVVNGMIKTYPSSRYDEDKRIYAVEDKEGEVTTLIVSNGTECDEFYEVLDALYRDRATVAKLHEMSAARRIYDEQANHRYEESRFNHDLSEFVIGDGHRAPSSLFEIPLMYYNSLPRAKLDDNEITIMVDTIIDILAQEVARFEQDKDQDPFLANLLIKQFNLFVANYKNDEFDKNGAMRKNTDINDNRVINIALRKVCNKIEDLGVYQFNEKINALRMLVKDAAAEMENRKKAASAENE